MITPTLKLALEPIIARHRVVRALRWSAGLLAGLAVGWWVWKATGHRPHLPILLVLTYFAGWRIPRLLAKRWSPDFSAIGRQIEEKHPELHAALLTAIEQRPDPETGRLHFLQQKVIAEVLALARTNPWIDAAPKWQVGAGYVGVALALCAVFLAARPIPNPALAKSVAKANATVTETVEVTPGDTEIERGTGLVVLAKFGRKVPTEATLVVQPKNQPVQRVPLVKNLDDPVFGGGLPEVDGDLSYRVEYAGEATRDFSVKVFEHPRLERADATIHFPSYTGQPEKLLPDTHRVSAVEGSKLDVRFQLNKPVKSAQLVTKDGKSVALQADPTQPLASLSGFEITKSQSYELRLVDADDRPNKLPAQFAIDSLANKRPELKLITPRGDVRVSPLEEVAFRVEAWDDFGLARYGLTYTVAGRQAQDVELGHGTKPDERVQGEQLLKLESLGMKPDELISYFAWAEDTGPDGKPRRTSTDLFFAEVRPFEEIYKPGDGGEGKPSGKEGGAEAMKLAELQKQIISATWNLKRTEDANAGATKPDAKYLKDEPVIRDSQAEVLNQAKALAEKAEEPKTKDLIDDATHEMQGALEHLQAAEKTAGPVPEALTSEQSAYNALLKLAAHEFRVMRNQQSKGNSSAQQRQQAQLEELEMKEEKKRYETKSEAESQQPEQQKEQLAILNRLKELAQRQQDINERLKELQTALQAAKSDEQKEDIRRQLKRLKEEEQQLLSDLDETRQKMEQSQQQSQLADERHQLDQTRQEAQKASEAMEKNATTEALANGTRAARQLQQMRDDFRKKTSAQFNDEMRQMRNNARELAQNQKDIAEKLAAEPTKAERRTLDGSSEGEKLGDRFDKQREGLDKLTENMKRVSDQAEAAEPLLARELYDTLRKTAQSDTGKTLEMTKTLSDRGYQTQARKFEEKARQEIDELKTGVERAAESVLGDEAEALRQARAELDNLTRQLEREIGQARPDLAATEPGKDPKQPSEGTKPGDQPSDQPGATEGKQKLAEANQPGEKANAKTQGDAKGEPAPGKPESGGTKPGDKPRQLASNQPGDKAQGQQGEGQKPGGKEGGNQPGQPGQQSGAQASTAEGSQGQQQGSKGGEGKAATGSRLADLAKGGNQRQAGAASGGGGGMNGGAFDGQTGPLTGEKFVDWSDRLRNVEEMLDAPELRREAAGIREAARGVRAEYKRHAAQPDWDFVKNKISKPLAELRNRVTEELARRDSKENLVPIDRDPVPTQYAERVRRYYEELGRSR